jgi:hypothetical protein
MNNKSESTFLQKNIMLVSILISAFVALLVSTATGDQTVWAYMIPLGVATGTAIHAGQNKQAL